MPSMIIHKISSFVSKANNRNHFIGDSPLKGEYFSWNPLPGPHKSPISRPPFSAVSLQDVGEVPLNRQSTSLSSKTVLRMTWPKGNSFVKRGFTTSWPSANQLIGLLTRNYTLFLAPAWSDPVTCLLCYSKRQISQGPPVAHRLISICEFITDNRVTAVLLSLAVNCRLRDSRVPLDVQ